MINFKGYRILVTEIEDGFLVIATEDGFNSFELVERNLNYFEAIIKAKQLINDLNRG